MTTKLPNHDLLRMRRACCRWKHTVARIAREPLLQMVLLGAATFALSHWVDARSNPMRIVVTSHQIDEFSRRFQAQYGSRPSRQQLEGVVERYINGEILYRKALAMGLDRNDEIVRRRLIQKYEFLRHDLQIPTEPSETQLRRYYHDNLTNYQEPPRATLTHVYLSSDTHDDDAAREKLVRLSARLNTSGAERALGQGDTFPGPYELAGLSEEGAIRIFGRREVVQAIFTCETQHWTGPLRSAFGWHSIYVSDRQDTRQSAFDDVRLRVKEDYLQSERERSNAESMAVLRGEFEIVRE